MAADLIDGIGAGETIYRFEHAPGEPRWEFMQAALHQYNKMGGTVRTHVGGPAQAILELVRS
jgi:hypothetical protein